MARSRAPTPLDRVIGCVAANSAKRARAAPVSAIHSRAKAAA